MIEGSHRRDLGAELSPGARARHLLVCRRLLRDDSWRLSSQDDARGERYDNKTFQQFDLQFIKLPDQLRRVTRRVAHAITTANSIPIRPGIAQETGRSFCIRFDRATVAALRLSRRGSFDRSLVSRVASKLTAFQATNSLIRVLLVNTAYNNHPASERDYVASTIAALLAKEAETDPAFKQVVSLHVEFVKHGLWFTKTVDIVEFRKGADGAFK